MRIQDVTAFDALSLEDVDKQDIFVLNLQRAVQAAIDIAHTVIKTEELDIPQAYREAFILLHAKQIVSEEVADKMQRMCGFRNIAIHAYNKLDLNILKSILTKDLPDLESFYQEIWTYYETRSI